RPPPSPTPCGGGSATRTCATAVRWTWRPASCSAALLTTACLARSRRRGRRIRRRVGARQRHRPRAELVDRPHFELEGPIGELVVRVSAVADQFDPAALRHGVRLAHVAERGAGRADEFV